jgi:hypothetical protein
MSLAMIKAKKTNYSIRDPPFKLPKSRGLSPEQMFTLL